MGMFIGLLGLAIFIVCIGFGIFSLFKKNKKAKLSFLLSLIGVFLFFTGLTISALHEQSDTVEEPESTYSEEESSTEDSDEDSVEDSDTDYSEESDAQSSSSEEPAKSQDEIIAEKLPNNVLYGYRDESDSKKNSNGGWVIEGRDYVRFWTNDKGIIESMKLDFKDFPLMADDPDNEEYITDNTAEDAVKTVSLGDDKYIYHSNKYDLDYQIHFVKNSNGDISFIQIFPKQ